MEVKKIQDGSKVTLQVSSAGLRVLLQGVKEPDKNCLEARKVSAQLLEKLLKDNGVFSPYTDKMRSYCGQIPIYFSVYTASESLMDVARFVEEEEFVLIPNTGFYEFIPMDSKKE